MSQLGNTNGANPEPLHPEITKRLDEVHKLVVNSLEDGILTRSQLIGQLNDPRRDIEAECGHPKNITGAMYQHLYDRNAIAARVVEVLPLESWQVAPTVYEEEDASKITPFEEKWDSLGQNLQLGEESWFKTEEGSPIWEYLRRADIQSGIGHFGILVIGIDDGQDFSTPAEGVDDYSIFTSSRSNGSSNSPPSNPTNPASPYSQGTVGTDAQYYDYLSVPTPPGRLKYPPPVDKNRPREERNLTFLKVFPERLVQITQYETNMASPRFGQPVMYSATFNDPLDTGGGIGLTLANVNIHWTRVIHIADNIGASEVLGIPRMQQVYNNILDLQKMYGGSAEMYWKGAFPGISLETHPSLGGDIPVAKEEMRKMMENYMHGLQRYIAPLGFSAKSLSPQVVDPRPQIEVQIEAICIKLGIPLRIFKGSERGQLASQQDDSSWNDRLAARQCKYLTPRLIAPFVNRLIALGVLPIPKDGFKVEWPKLDSLVESELSNISLTNTKAIAAYATGGGPMVMAPMDFYTRIMNFDEAEAKEIVDALPDPKALAAIAQPANAQPSPAQSNKSGSSANGNSAKSGSNGAVGANPRGVGGNRTETPGNKVKYGRSPAPTKLPVAVNNADATMNNHLFQDITDSVNEIADELGLTEDERNELYEQFTSARSSGYQVTNLGSGQE